MNICRRFARFAVATACFGVALGAATTWAAADAGAQSDTPLHCLNLVQLRQAKVLDRHHIVFETSGGKTYMNTLPRPCPGLDQDKPFLYRPTLNQLCDLDVITVLESFGGGFTTAASCGLGAFVPVPSHQVRDVLRKTPRGPRY